MSNPQILMAENAEYRSRINRMAKGMGELRRENEEAVRLLERSFSAVKEMNKVGTWEHYGPLEEEIKKFLAKRKEG